MTRTKFYESLLLEELAEHMGTEEGVEAFVKVFGGRQISIPRQAKPDQKIARTCGLEVEQALVDIFGGEQVEVPTDGLNRPVTKKEMILQLEGSHNEVAAKVGCGFRWVKRVRSMAGMTRKKIGPTKKQLILATPGDAEEVAEKVGCCVRYVLLVRADAD